MMIVRNLEEKITKEREKRGRIKIMMNRKIEGLIFILKNREKKGKQHGNNYIILHHSSSNTCNLSVEQSRAAGKDKSSYGV